MIKDGKIILVVITMLVNVANYGLNLLLARWLGPAFFAEANLFATLVLFLSFIAVGVQLTVAKVVAENKANHLTYLRNELVKMTKMIVAILLVLAYSLSVFLNLSSVWPLILLIVSIPFYFLMCFDRGQYQGKSQFSLLGYTFLCEMLVRFLLTIGLVLILPLASASYAVVIGFVASFFVTQRLFKIDVTAVEITIPKIESILTFLKIITLYELSQILINNADVILVKHLFAAEEAGLYAATSILGKAVFFATGIVVTVLFPKVIEKKNKGLNHKTLFWKSLFIVFAIGMLMVLASLLCGQQIMSLAFGDSYTNVSQYLWQYALLTCLFSCSNVFVYYHLTLQSYVPVFISVICGIVQVSLILFFGESFAIVLGVQIAVMSLLLSALMIYHMLVTRDLPSHTSSLHSSLSV